MLACVFTVDLEALPGGAIQGDFHGVVEYESAFFQPLGDGGDHVCAKHLEDCEDTGEAGDAINSENPKTDVERVARVGDDGEGPEASHWEDLPDSERTFLWLDAFQDGIGTRSCGPDSRPEFAGCMRDTDLTFVIAQVGGD